MERIGVERLHPPSASFSRQNIVPCSCRKKDMIGDDGFSVGREGRWSAFFDTDVDLV